MTVPHSRLILTSADLYEAMDYMEAFLAQKAGAYPFEVQRALKVAAIVTYCRPFTGNNGKDGKKRERLAVEDYVEPGPLIEVHEQAMTLRNELLAHADFNARPNDARLSESGHPVMEFTLFDVMADPIDMVKLLLLAGTIVQKVDQQRATYMALLIPSL